MKREVPIIGALAIASVATLNAQNSPNVIIIMTDQQRADICGREGFPMDVTPFVDSLAQSNIWFNKAYTTMPASSPARCSMLTGRYPTATHVRTNHNIEDVYYQTDLIDVLEERDYKMALIGKNHSHLKPSTLDYHVGYGHWGKDKPQTAEQREAKKFFRENFGQCLEPSPIPVEQQQPTQIVDKTIEWIDSVEGENPFFAWVSFPEPHNPNQVCEPYYSMFAPENLPATLTSRSDLNGKGEKYSILGELEDAAYPDLERDLPRLRGNYIGMVRLIDDQIRRLVESLKDKGVYDNTIIVILSDHGDYCGEYGLMRKGAGLCESLTRIPMVWAGYNIKPNKELLKEHVSIADVFPTICSAIGENIPIGVQGRSLWPMLSGEEYPEAEFASVYAQLGFGGEDVPLTDELTFREEGALRKGQIGLFDCLNTWTQSGASRMVRKGDWKLIMDSYGNGELYNIRKDPSEIDDLYNKRRYKDLVSSLMVDMLSWEMRLQDPLPLPRARYHFKQNEYNYHSTETNR